MEKIKFVTMAAVCAMGEGDEKFKKAVRELFDMDAVWDFSSEFADTISEAEYRELLLEILKNCIPQYLK